MVKIGRIINKENPELSPKELPMEHPGNDSEDANKNLRLRMFEGVLVNACLKGATNYMKKHENGTVVL